jgi:hypothetical protein
MSSFLMHRVEIVETRPQTLHWIDHLFDPIEIDFSEPIPSRLRTFPFITLSIKPEIPLKRVWIYSQDPSETRTLWIYPEIYSAGSDRPHFEPYTNYHLKVGGFLLKKPVEIVFLTRGRDEQ